MAVFGAERQHRALQSAAERFGFDLHSEAAGLIGHVQQHHGGQAQLLHLQGEAQLPVELAGIEHYQH